MQETGICLDFDDSAVISHMFKKYLNPNLVNSFGNNDISRLFFLTDMTFTRHFMIEREEFFGQLRNAGYDIPYVITPMDLAWSHPLFEAACKISEENWVKIYNKSKELTQDAFFEYLEKNGYKHLKPIFRYSPNHLTPGAAYQAAIEACQQEDIDLDTATAPLPDDLQRKGNIAKFIADIMSAHNGYDESKALLLDLFIRKKPDWVANVLVVDDKTSVKDDINKYLQSNIPLLPVTFLHVTEGLRDIEDSNEIKNKYQEVLDTHTQKFHNSQQTFLSGKESGILQNKLKELYSAISRLKGFGDSNSTFIKELVRTLIPASAGHTSPTEELFKIIKKAKGKTQGLRNYYANSHFFCHGRNPIVQQIYERIAAIKTVHDIDNVIAFINGKNISARNTRGIIKLIENDCFSRALSCDPINAINPTFLIPGIRV